MITLEKLKKGLSAYLDDEVIPNLPGWRQFVFGGAAALLISNLDRWMQHPVVAALGIVNGNMVDIDSAYKEIRKRVNAPFSVNVPGIGEMKFMPEDIDRLYQRLRGE